jgi:uncharacterized protein YydD (DUF2326 family)
MDFLQKATELNGHRLNERRAILKEMIVDKQADLKRLQSEIGGLKKQQARLSDIAKQNRAARKSAETK